MSRLCLRGVDSSRSGRVKMLEKVDTSSVHDSPRKIPQQNSQLRFVPRHSCPTESDEFNVIALMLTDEGCSGATAGPDSNPRQVYVYVSECSFTSRPWELLSVPASLAWTRRTEIEQGERGLERRRDESSAVDLAVRTPDRIGNRGPAVSRCSNKGGGVPNDKACTDAHRATTITVSKVAPPALDIVALTGPLAQIVPLQTPTSDCLAKGVTLLRRLALFIWRGNEEHWKQTRKCTRICVEEEYKIILKKTTLSTPGQDSNLNLPIIIISLVYCESSALDHAATEAGNLPDQDSRPRPHRQQQTRQYETIALVHMTTGAGKSRVGRRPHWIYWNRYSRNNSSAKSTEIRFPDGSRVPPLPLGKTNKRLVVSLSYRPTPTILTDCEYPSLHLVTEPFLHIHSESDASCIHSSKHENTPLRSIPVRRYSTCHNRHGTGGSASSPKEVLLRMFIAQEKSVDPDWVQTQWREPLYEPTY
uniref:Uncharacterized protein n=1 Tax=Timema bartmani TaxID=61472 RepID=A0A7R9I550_9NEOP|nr:unnamed protein product [Timema bartmani]